MGQAGKNTETKSLSQQGQQRSDLDKAYLMCSQSTANYVHLWPKLLVPEH